MSELLCHPTAAIGRVHHITPEAAGWRYVGFDLHRIEAGQSAGETLPGDREAILVLVEGHSRLSAAGTDFGRLGTRNSVFEEVPPPALYLPPGAEWHAGAETAATLAVCTAPSPGGRPAALIGPDGITRATRGEGTNIRHIHAIAMEERDVADSLLVTEVFTPPGHWSSYPPHRHDEDDFPRVTHLEETYYHRLDPGQGTFALQRVYTEDGSLDATMAVADHDVVLVPRGHHPCAAPHGVAMYYLNVMAGPRRAWRFVTDPAFSHLVPAS